MLREFRSSVNITGVERIFDRSTHFTRRILWFFLICGGSVFLVYHLYRRIEYYTTNPVMINMKMIYPEAMEFPAVTVCNANSFKKSNVTSQSPLDDVVIDLLADGARGKEAIIKRHGSKLTSYNITDMIIRHSHDIGTMLTYSYWDQTELSSKNFSRVFIDFETCYTFNLANKAIATSAGIQYALMIRVDTEVQYYRHGVPEIGFKAIVHYPTDVPIIFTTKSFVSMNPRTTSYVSLRKVVTRSLSPPYGKCGAKQLKYFNKYLAISCQMECMTDYALKTCGCKLINMPSKEKVCSPAEYYNCTEILLKAYSREVQRCSCPLDCYSVHYEKSITVGKFKDTNETNNEAVIWVFFEDLRYTEIQQQQAYTWLALLSDIGGALGLVLGSCLLTIAQVFDVVFTAILQKITITKLIKKNSSQENQTSLNNSRPRRYPRTAFI